MYFTQLARRDQQEAHSYEMAWIYLATGKVACPTCGGVDPLGGGAMDINCETCNGTGWVVTYARSAARIRVLHSRPDMVYLSQIVGTGKMGDYLLLAEYRDKRVFEAAVDDPLAYVVIDGSVKVKPTTISMNRVEGPLSLEVECKRIGFRDREG